jgi:hypothetical protein
MLLKPNRRLGMILAPTRRATLEVRRALRGRYAEGRRSRWAPWSACSPWSATLRGAGHAQKARVTGPATRGGECLIDRNVLARAEERGPGQG